MKILMVCLGNICRSPLAEGILKSKLPDNFLVDSAGTGGWHAGEQPDPRSIAIAKDNSIDISQQRARQFTKNDFKTFDRIYAMDNSNFESILAQSGTQTDSNKVSLILNELYPDENLDVPDPYYGGAQGFKNVYEMLDAACECIAQKVKHLTP